jgi:hypothetical protein
VSLSAWVRWRYGERVCVVCGEAPDGSVAFPPESWVAINLAAHGEPWLVPVCGRHHQRSLWPVRVALELADEHRAVLRGDPPRTLQVDLWDTPPPLARIGADRRGPPGGPG